MNYKYRDIQLRVSRGRLIVRFKGFIPADLELMTKESFISYMKKLGYNPKN